MRFSALLLPLLILPAGCSSTTSTPLTKAASEDSLHVETERGPVRVSVDVVPREPRLSDEPTMTLTIRSQDGVSVTAPPFGDSLGEFVIRDFYEPLPRTENGVQIAQQVYTLEPTQAGVLTIEPMVIRFVDGRSDGDGKEHVIETDAIRLNVATIIDAAAPSLNDLRPAAPPQSLPDSTAASWLWLVVGSILALVVIGLLLSRLKPGRDKTEPQLTPQQLARRELDELIASKLSATDVKEFFVQLTFVVRRFIERSTGIRAPEQTTEEFLRETTGSRLFSSDVQQRLAVFLESADLVKFAGFQPDPEAIKQSTQKAKQFIEKGMDLTGSPPQSVPTDTPEAEHSRDATTGPESESPRSSEAFTSEEQA